MRADTRMRRVYHQNELSAPRYELCYALGTLVMLSRLRLDLLRWDAFRWSNGPMSSANYDTHPHIQMLG